MKLPSRRKKAKRPTGRGPVRSASHLAWLRGHVCSLAGTTRDINAEIHSERIEAAHVRTGTDGGVSSKPGDNWAIPLCSRHHHEQHQIGERTFEARYGIDLKAIAKALADRSPHLRKLKAA